MQTRINSSLIYSFFSLVSVTILSYFLFLHTNTKLYSIIFVFIFLYVCHCTNKLHKMYFSSNHREFKITCFFSYVFILFYFIGILLDKGEHLGKENLLLVLLSSLSLTPPLSFMILYVNSKIIPFFDYSYPRFQKSDYKIFFKYLLFFLMLWFPIFLAYFPGLFAYDVMRQIPQTLGSYNTHHPLLHTILLQFFYHLGGLFGNYNLGIACYTLFQMLIMATIFSYLILFLYRIRCCKIFRLFIVIFLGIIPFSSILVISVTKDILFSGFILLACICLGYWSIDKNLYYNKTLQILYIIAILGICFFRNNGFYISIILTSSSFLLYKHNPRQRKFFLKNMFFCLLIYITLHAGLVYLCQAKPGSSNEIFSIPYQQIAHVYTYQNNVLDADIKSEIESMFPSIQHYTKYRSDPVKGDAEALNNLPKFITLYIKLFIKYPHFYAEALLLNTQGYWYLDDISHSQIYGYGLDTRQGYLLTDTKQGFSVFHRSYFPCLEYLYELLFSANKYQHIPILSPLFSPAFYLWIYMYTFFYALAKKRNNASMPHALMLGLLLTILLGPCALIRYAFPYIICIPVILLLSLGNRT